MRWSHFYTLTNHLSFLLKCLFKCFCNFLYNTELEDIQTHRICIILNMDLLLVMYVTKFIPSLFIFFVFDEKFSVLIGYIYQIISLSFKETLPYIKHSPIFSSKGFNVASHIQAFSQPWVDFCMLCETGSNCQLSLFPHRSSILWAHFQVPPHCSIRFPVIYQGSHKHGSVPALVFWSWYLTVQSFSHVWLFGTPWLQHARLPVLHYLLELTQTHVHHVGGVIQPSHALSSPSPAPLNLSQPTGSFPMSQFFASGGKSIGVSATPRTDLL